MALVPFDEGPGNAHDATGQPQSDGKPEAPAPLGSRACGVVPQHSGGPAAVHAGRRPGTAAASHTVPDAVRPEEPQRRHHRGGAGPQAAQGQSGAHHSGHQQGGCLRKTRSGGKTAGCEEGSGRWRLSGRGSWRGP